MDEPFTREPPVLEGSQAGRSPQVGDWCSHCCWRDVYRLEDEDELDTVVTNHVEGYESYGFWATEEEAFDALVTDDINDLDDLSYYEENEPWRATAVKEALMRIRALEDSL